MLTSQRTYHRAISIAAASCIVLAQAPATLASSPDRPNIILIMTDDQGYGDLGFTGDMVIQTPHIDAMASRSARMEYFYVSPVCTPTRACLMTGRYNYRTRAIDTYIGRARMEPDELTLAEILHDAGYATGIFGKWHLGDNYPMRAMDQGFEQALVHRGGGIGQPSDPPGGEGRYTDAILFDNGRREQTKGYCTDVYFDRAMKWIQKVSDENRSFFVYLPTNAPHGPFSDVPEDLYKEYKANVKNDTQARIYAMITNIDQNVGRLFKSLDELALTRNTMVIFMVDNGPNGVRHSAGLRGTKGSVWEGGIRSPFFAHWPARLKAGIASNRIAAHIDVLPTILEACGVQAPQDLLLDGRSLLPLLEGRRVDWPDRTLFIQAHRGNIPILFNNFAARSQRWKLLHANGFGNETLNGPVNFELFDMLNDPLEKNNVAVERPQIVTELEAQARAWFADVSTTRPDNYAQPRIHVGTSHENPTVLTRQDWFHRKGGKWHPNSNGTWPLYVARRGRFDIHLRIRSLKHPALVELKVGGHHLSQQVEANTLTHSFEGVMLGRGDTRLETFITYNNISKGAWQVTVAQR